MTDEELIEAVATEVMKCNKNLKRWLGMVEWGWYYKDKLDERMWSDLWNPIEDMNHMMMVVDKMRKLGFNFNLNWQAHPGITVAIAQFHKIAPFTYGQGSDDIVGKAVCLAALEAVRS